MREKSEKVGTSKKFIDWIDYDSHYPDKVAYNLADVFSDLMRFSYRHLKLNGMLVYWYPVSRPELKGTNRGHFGMAIFSDSISKVPVFLCFFPKRISYEKSWDFCVFFPKKNLK